MHFKEAVKLARKMQAYLKREVRDSLPRPFIIEISGIPSAGKTTLIGLLDTAFRRLGFRVLRPQEGPEIVRTISRKTWLYNVRTALCTLPLLIDEAHDTAYDIIILDRGPFDAYAWFTRWFEEGKMSEQDRRLVGDFFTNPMWTQYIDRAYYCVIDPDEAMRRSLAHTPFADPPDGETTNTANLVRFNMLWRQAYNELIQNPAYAEKLCLVDTTEYTPEMLAQFVLKDALQVLAQKSEATTADTAGKLA